MMMQRQETAQLLKGFVITFTHSAGFGVHSIAIWVNRQLVLRVTDGTKHLQQ